ncbi:hypothetical protein ACQZ4Q_08175 [Agrobacterium vitis]
MKHIFITLAALISCSYSACQAQQFIDDTSKNIAKEELSAIKQGIFIISRDPLAAQIGGLRYGKSESICGMANLKNGYGAYSGFQPMILYAGTLIVREKQFDQCE